MPQDLTTTRSEPPSPFPTDEVPAPLALAIGWSVHEPLRIGEVALLDGPGPLVVGRQGTVVWMRHRPRERTPTGDLGDPALSREQLVFRAGTAGRSAVACVGRAPMRVNGATVEACEVGPGDVIEVGDRLVLVVHRRPIELAGERPSHPFGEADSQGFVGEGVAAWALREDIRFYAGRPAHVLVSGESGTGKELVARALHTLSGRSRGPWVARSAATIPESLADAELFGNLASYPNPGMVARPGLVGEADGGTLFLDEFGELPLELQSRLLRVLDSGEYTRLGDAKARRSDLRLVAATNRPLDALKHDVLARLPLRMTVPSLSERREDIALIVVHLLREILRVDPKVGGRWSRGGPKVTTRLMAALISHPYRTNVRELSSLLWRAIGAQRGELDLFPGYAELTRAPEPVGEGPVNPSRLSREAVQACLDRNGGQQELAWRELGLSSRHALARLVKKYGLVVRRRG